MSYQTHPRGNPSDELHSSLLLPRDRSGAAWQYPAAAHHLATHSSSANSSFAGPQAPHGAPAMHAAGTDPSWPRGTDRIAGAGAGDYFVHHGGGSAPVDHRAADEYSFVGHGRGASYSDVPFASASSYSSAYSNPTDMPTPTSTSSYESYPSYPSTSSFDPDATISPYDAPEPSYSFPTSAYDAARFVQPRDVADPGRALAMFLGLPEAGSRAGVEVLQDSLMAFDDGFETATSLPPQSEDALYFGTSPRGYKYQYQLDPTFPSPGQYLPSPSSSASSSVYASPFAPAHSLPGTAYSSPQPSPHQRMASLPGTSYTGYAEGPHASPSFTPSGVAPIAFMPSTVTPSQTTSPIPFPRSNTSALVAPLTPTIPNRTTSRSQPTSRTPSFSHLPAFSPYPSPTQRPPAHHRHSSSNSSSIHRHPSTPNLHSAHSSFSRPAPSAIQPGPNPAPFPTTLFDSPIKVSSHRLRQSLSFPSPAAALQHRRSQSHSTRGVAAGSQAQLDSVALDNLSGLGFDVGRRESVDSTWSEETGPSRKGSTGTRTPGFGGDHGWPGPVPEVAGMRDRMESLHLKQDRVGDSMDRGEGAVVLVHGNEALEDASRQYLESPDRLMEGERAVLVLAPRIAQRSYGSEKRFLCPQPMSLLLGASWWSSVEDPRIKPESLPYASAKIRRINLPPEINISISTDPNPATDGLLTEWMTKEGELVDPEWPIDNDTLVLAGRTTGKSNYVPAGETSAKDKRPTVRPLVTVVAPGAGPKESRLIGTFPGKAMHIISKPSKGKLTESSKTCLVHGDLVSLYNRVKSQTASTRFLGVSGNHSSFPTMDWRAMTGGQARPFAPDDVHATTFVARTGRWDAFVIYAVDLNLPKLDPSIVPAPAPFSGYPRPPVNAIPFVPGQEKKIYYNMPIVLQCLSTAVVSPIMIVRKVDQNRSAIGGGSTTGYSSTHGLPCAPGERLGEAVAQFRPMALEIYTDPTTVPLGERSPTENTFLACLGDAIGINQSREVRKYFNPSGSGFDSDSPPPLGAVPSPKMAPLTPSPNFLSSGLPTPMPEFPVHDEDQSSNGAKVKRARRMSSSGNVSQSPYSPSRPPSSLSKHRNRGQSLSNLSSLYDSSSDDEPLPRVWSIDCGDPCVWTIVAIDLARHTFHVPAMVQGGKHTGIAPPLAEVSHLFKSPIPCYPISPLIPLVVEYDPPLRRAGPHDTGTEEDTMITLHGENFSSAFTVWLGSAPCSRQMHKSTWRLLVSPPKRSPDHQNPNHEEEPLRISLVRNDGVIFPSCVFYNEA